MPFNKKLLILIPLVLSAFAHLWNAALFPSFHIDEGVYIRRALYTMSGLGPLDPASRFDHPQDSTSSYDHPFFGQILLATIFKIINFPQIVNTGSESVSMEAVFGVPRLIMGAMSVLDTLLVYKIAERRFNPTVALFSSLLFAVMPSTWFTRRIVLDSLLLPFVLTSVLLALQIRSHARYVSTLSVLSGIFLGLGIFTKIPSFTMIPLLIYLISPGLDRRTLLSKKYVKKIGVFIIPVIMIPLIWPAYAFVSGDANQWFDGVFWQATQRQSEDKTLFGVIMSFYKTDPVLLIMGTIGVAYLAFRREFIGVIWMIPYFVLLYLVGWVNHFHLILVLPIWCISLGKLAYDLPFIVRIKRKEIILSSGIILAIVMFGITSTALLISTDLTYIQLKSASYVANEVISDNGKLSNAKNKPMQNVSNNRSEQLTVIAAPIYSWVYQYVFNHENTFSHIRDTQPIKTDNVILLVDSTYKRLVSRSEAENQTQVTRLNGIYNDTEVSALFGKLPANYSKKNYPFTGIDSADSGLSPTEIRKNY
jgi:4-amino-4-deoxy-L-arabinose transferase-like glycosyltransferase